MARARALSSHGTVLRKAWKGQWRRRAHYAQLDFEVKQKVRSTRPPPASLLGFRAEGGRNSLLLERRQAKDRERE
jgi:hypothetical protein